MLIAFLYRRQAGFDTDTGIIPITIKIEIPYGVRIEACIVVITIGIIRHITGWSGGRTHGNALSSITKAVVVKIPVKGSVSRLVDIDSSAHSALVRNSAVCYHTVPTTLRLASDNGCSIGFTIDVRKRSGFTRGAYLPLVGNSLRFQISVNRKAKRRIGTNRASV